MYKIKYLKDDYQKEIFRKAEKIIERKGVVGLEVFTSGGKSPISAELINYLKEKHDCKNVLVVAKEATWRAVKSRYDSIGVSDVNIYHVKNALLSRKRKLHDCISEQGINPDDIDIILFDECHQLFGTNIRDELDANTEYIYSKYVIAMTATTYTGIKMINSLTEIVGKDNIVKYDLNDAVHSDIIDPINMINVRLACKPEYYAELDDILNSRADSIKNKKLINLINNTKDTISKHNISNIEDVILSNILDGAKRYHVKLDAKNGARVIIFFNYIDDIKRYKDILINVMSKIYNGSKINFITYVSKSNNKESEDAIRVLTSSTCDKNTVDIIATCDMGAESFHPVQVQLGLVFGGTQSIRKELQRIGRFITLKQYKTCDCLIFDFSNSYNRLCNRTFNVGKTEINSRTSTALILGRYFNDKTSDIETLLAEYDDSINITTSSIDDNIMNLIDRTEALVNILVGNDDLLAYIDKNIRLINNTYSGYSGNIAKFLRDKSSIDKEVISNNYYERYETVRKYITYPILNKTDMKLLSNSFGKYGASNYLSIGMSSDRISDVKVMYGKLNRGTFNINDYWKDYVKRLLPPECIMMIRKDKDILNEINERIIRCSSYNLGIASKSALDIRVTAYLKCLGLLNNSKGAVKTKLNRIITICYKYFEVAYNSKETEQDIKNVLQMLMLLAYDKNVKFTKFTKVESNAIKLLSILDICRDKDNYTITSTKWENYAIDLYSRGINRLTKIEKEVIEMCMSDYDLNDDEKIKEFIEQSLHMTRTYKIVDLASSSNKCKDLIRLKKYVENGGEIPNKLYKEYKVSELLKKADKITTIRQNPSIINRKNTSITPMQFIEVCIDNDKLYSNILSLIFMKKGKVKDTTGINYNRLLFKVKNEISFSDMHKINDIKQYNIITNDSAINSVLCDIC